MTSALPLWWRLRSAHSPADRGASRTIDALAVAAYAVASGALLITLGGLHAFQQRHENSPTDLSSMYVALSVIAAGLLIVPILTLGGVAARLSLGRRDARLATLRLCGATSGQVSVMVLAEAVHQALLGALGGCAVYAMAIPVVTRISFENRLLSAGELWLGFLPVIGVILCVVALAVVSGLSSLGAVVVGPLGVARRTTPGRLRLWRVAIGGVLLVIWIFGGRILGQLSIAAVGVVLAGLVGAVNLAGPVFVQVVGRVFAHSVRSAAALIAARRIVDDPRATWRTVSAVGLAICLSALSSISSAPVTSPREQTIAADMGTGALIALFIVSAVAATSTGVVQAARVIDQRETYRDLALAGTPLSVLHRSRTMEVAMPLAVALAIGSFLPMLILLPFSSVIGMGVLLRVLAALALSVLAILGSVYFSRGLATRYALGT